MKSPWKKDDSGQEFIYVLDSDRREKLKPVMLELATFLQDKTEGPYEAYAILHEMMEALLKYANVEAVEVGHVPKESA